MARESNANESVGSRCQSGSVGATLGGEQEGAETQYTVHSGQDSGATQDTGGSGPRSPASEERGGSECETGLDIGQESVAIQESVLRVMQGLSIDETHTEVSLQDRSCTCLVVRNLSPLIEYVFAGRSGRDGR